MIPKKPKIDILLPYWGDFSYFKLAVESVLRQTETNWRLLIFDDHYPVLDAKRFIKSLDDKRIVYHRHPKNLGITSNFNFALENATAEYFVMFGCDDVMLPNFIERGLNNIGDVDFYQPGVEVIDKDGKIYAPLGDKIKIFLAPNKSTNLKGERLAASLCTGNWLYFPSIIWKTKTVKKYKFDPKYRIVEDVKLELNIIADGGKLHFDKERTFQYRRFADSLSSKEKSKNGVRFKEEKDVYDYFATKFKNKGWHCASAAAKIRITSRIHSLLS